MDSWSLTPAAPIFFQDSNLSQLVLWTCPALLEPGQKSTKQAADGSNLGYQYGPFLKSWQS